MLLTESSRDTNECAEIAGVDRRDATRTQGGQW